MNPTLRDMVDLLRVCPHLTAADVCGMKQDDVEVNVSRGTFRVSRPGRRPLALAPNATLIVMRQPISETPGAPVFAKPDGTSFTVAELVEPAEVRE